MTPITDREALAILAGLSDNPDDRTGWLVLADRLDDLDLGEQAGRVRDWWPAEDYAVARWDNRVYETVPTPTVDGGTDNRGAWRLAGVALVRLLQRIRPVDYDRIDWQCQGADVFHRQAVRRAAWVVTAYAFGLTDAASLMEVSRTMHAAEQSALRAIPRHTGAGARVTSAWAAAFTAQVLEFASCPPADELVGDMPDLLVSAAGYRAAYATGPRNRTRQRRSYRSLENRTISQAARFLFDCLARWPH